MYHLQIIFIVLLLHQMLDPIYLFSLMILMLLNENKPDFTAQKSETLFITSNHLIKKLLVNGVIAHKCFKLKRLISSSNNARSSSLVTSQHDSSSRPSCMTPPQQPYSLNLNTLIPLTSIALYLYTKRIVGKIKLQILRIDIL